MVSARRPGGPPAASGPLDRYHASIAAGDFTPDSAQAATALELQRVYAALAARWALAPRDAGWFRRIRNLTWAARPELVPGLYLWGGVGRGKTWLMDTFYDSLTGTEALREHFHSFMQRVHRQLKSLHDVPDPLNTVAARIADQTSVICVDEFHVSDIADAMLLGRLLGALFDRGVTLMTTSNIAPDRLYEGGLQRERFLPAIEHIKRCTRVLHLDGEIDYRLRALERAEIYHHPLDEQAEQSLRHCFYELHPEYVREGYRLEVLGREIRTVCHAQGVVWFDFFDLCDGPRATADYIEIARCFHTVLIGNVPIMSGPEDDDRARRFIELVDEFYDRNVNLVVSAADVPSRLYRGKRLTRAFDRTGSRLEEMQSREYLARTHRS